MDTLEYFAYHPGWHASKQVEKDLMLGRLKMPEQSRAIQMRLLRYSRQGLLARRRVERGYEYRLTTKGENRLFYFWEKLPEPNDSKASDLEVQRFEQRLSLKLSLLENRRRELASHSS